MKPIYRIKGRHETLEIFEHHLVISGPKGFVSNSIHFASITAIRFKPSGFLSPGLFVFVIPGGDGSRRPPAMWEPPPNTFEFKGNNPIATTIKNYIETRMQQLHSPFFSELQILSNLRERGILSDAEFHQIMGRLPGECR